MLSHCIQLFCSKSSVLAAWVDGMPVSIFWNKQSKENRHVSHAREPRGNISYCSTEYSANCFQNANACTNLNSQSPAWRSDPIAAPLGALASGAGATRSQIRR